MSIRARCVGIGFIACLSTCLAWPGVSAAVEAATTVRCNYPNIEVITGETRRIAGEAYAHFKKYSSAAAVAPECQVQYLRLLSSVAYALQAAGNANRSSAVFFRKRELEVRHRIFDEINSTELSTPVAALYRNNIERLGDIYHTNKAGREFLEDIVALDVNFKESGSRIAKVRNAVRKAIYSCDAWSFTHAVDTKHMQPQWENCTQDFESLAESIPNFESIAPAAKKFLVKKAFPSATIRAPGS